MKDLFLAPSSQNNQTSHLPMSPKKQPFGVKKKFQPSFPPSPPKKTRFLYLFKNEGKSPTLVLCTHTLISPLKQLLWKEGQNHSTLPPSLQPPFIIYNLIYLTYFHHLTLVPIQPCGALNTPPRFTCGYAHLFQPCTVLQETMQPGFQCSSVLQKMWRTFCCSSIANVQERCFAVFQAKVWKPPPCCWSRSANLWHTIRHWGRRLTI